MNDHQIGAALRAQVLSDRQRGLGADGRRLQAVAGDLCGGAQTSLLPALRYLVMSAAFASAAGQGDPLADPRLLPRLMQELQQVFTPAICLRMEDVLRGLLNLPSQGSAAVVPPIQLSQPSPPAPPAPAAMVPPGRPTETSQGRKGSGPSAMVAVLAFLAGGLLMALLGALVLLQQSRRLPLETSSSPPAPAVPNPVPQPAAEPMPPAEPPLPEAVTTPPSEPQVGVDEAVASIQGLYAALSSRNYIQARQFFGGAAADQFDPAFFRQFERVSVADLRETSRVGSSVNLQGTVTFVYPDGSTQSESRSFTVDTATDQAVITASEFGAVIKPR